MHFSALLVCFLTRKVFRKENSDPVVLLQDESVFFIIVDLQAEFHSPERDSTVYRNNMQRHFLCKAPFISHPNFISREERAGNRNAYFHLARRDEQ